MEMETTIECTTWIVLKFDPHSKEFKDAFESFKAVIYPEAKLQDMLNHISHNLIHFGHESMVEGVGYVKPNYKEWKDIPEPHSGIEWTSDSFPSFDFTLLH